MPKIKTHSGAKKRFKVTKNGKVKMNSANRRHDIKGCKSTKQKRHLRGSQILSEAMAANVKKLICK